MIRTNITNTPSEKHSPKISPGSIQKIHSNRSCAHMEENVETIVSMEQNGIECCNEPYPLAVCTALLSLALDFEKQEHFAIAEELRDIEARGPNRLKGMANFATPDVLQAATEHLAEMVRIAKKS